MEKVIIDAGIGTITASSNGNLQIQHLLEALKEKIETTSVSNVINLLK